MNSKQNPPIPKPTRKDLHRNTEQTIFEDTDPAVSRAQKSEKNTTSIGIEEMRPDKLKYMADMLVELRKISEDLDEKMVSYLIEMAILELHTVRSLSKFSGEISDKR